MNETGEQVGTGGEGEESGARSGPAVHASPVTPSVDSDRRVAPRRVEIPRRDEGNPVPPRDAMELKLVRIWETFLDVRPIGLRDDFFALGGNSLLGLRMFAAVEREIGPRLPVDTLLRAPTVEQLAGVLRRKESPGDWSSLVVMQRGGSRPPLFLIPTFSRNVLDYRELVRLLGQEQPVYGLQAQRSDYGLEAAQLRFEDMAAGHIEVIRAVQPTGPYYLGGYCVAGVVAFEMARQLQERGERVALLAIFDGAAPPGAGIRPSLLDPLVPVSFLRNLPCWMRNNLPHGRDHLLKRVAIRVKGETRTAWRRLILGKSPSEARNLEDFLGDVSHIPDIPRNAMRKHFRAFHSYRPPTYHGRVTLFRAEALPLFRPYDSELGWGALATGGVEVKVVAGSNHDLLQEPHVEGLAAQLRASLADAQDRTS